MSHADRPGVDVYADQAIAACSAMSPSSSSHAVEPAAERGGRPLKPGEVAVGRVEHQRQRESERRRLRGRPSRTERKATTPEAPRNKHDGRESDAHWDARGRRECAGEPPRRGRRPVTSQRLIRAAAFQFVLGTGQRAAAGRTAR